jgi:DNA-binding transcriptional LysR family regulator
MQATALLDLQLSDLQTFARVADTLSLSAVARERLVAVSQISRAINRLEAALKARLLHRGTHGLSLTSEGQLLLRHAQLVLDEAGELVAAFDSASGQVAGTVRVATSAGMAVFLLPSLASLREQHPRLVVDVAANDAIVDMAKEGIDVAIRVGTHGSDNLVARRLGQFERRLFATPGYLQRHPRLKHPNDLGQHVLITNTASASLNRWMFKPSPSSKAEPELYRPAGGLRTNDSAVQLAMVLHGLGIGRLNATIAAPWVKSGDLVEVLAEWSADQPVPIYAVMLPERHRHAKVRACIEHWVEWYGRFS